MNIFKGKIVADKKGLMFKGEDFSLNVKNIPSNLKNKPVEIGIRPEDIEISTGAENELKTKIEIVSNVGSEKYIYARIGSATLTARTKKDDNFKSGKDILLSINPSTLHIFYNGKRV